MLFDWYKKKLTKIGDRAELSDKEKNIQFDSLPE